MDTRCLVLFGLLLSQLDHSLLHNESLDLCILDQVDMLDQLIESVHLAHALMRIHSLVKEALLPGLLDLVHSLHGLHGLDHQISVIACWDVPLLLKFQYAVIGHLLAMSHSVGLGPLELSGVLLGFEEFVALAGAESEMLAVVAHKCRSMAWIYIARTEVTLFNTHSEGSCDCEVY